MDAFATALAVLVVALLWIGAITSGRDTRDGADWTARRDVRSHDPR